MSVRPPGASPTPSSLHPTSTPGQSCPKSLHGFFSCCHLGHLPGMKSQRPVPARRAPTTAGSGGPGLSWPCSAALSARRPHEHYCLGMCLAQTPTFSTCLPTGHATPTSTLEHEAGRNWVFRVLCSRPWSPEGQWQMDPTSPPNSTYSSQAGENTWQ